MIRALFALSLCIFGPQLHAQQLLPRVTNPDVQLLGYFDFQQLYLDTHNGQQPPPGWVDDKGQVLEITVPRAVSCPDFPSSVLGIGALSGPASVLGYAHSDNTIYLSIILLCDDSASGIEKVISTLKHEAVHTRQMRGRGRKYDFPPNPTPKQELETDILNGLRTLLNYVNELEAYTVEMEHLVELATSLTVPNRKALRDFAASTASQAVRMIECIDDPGLGLSKLNLLISQYLNSVGASRGDYNHGEATQAAANLAGRLTEYRNRALQAGPQLPSLYPDC